MKIALAIFLTIMAFNAMVMWSCCRVASREDRRLEQQDQENGSG